MTIPPHAASRHRPSAALLAQKLSPCNLNQILFPGCTVVACVRARESLTLKLETTEPAVRPKCGEPCIKIHDTRYRLIRDAPFPGVTVVRLLVPIRRVRCKCGCHRTETIPWIAHHEQCTNRFIALIQNRMRGEDASTTAVAAKYNLGWDAVRRFDKEQLEALFNNVNTEDLRIIAVDEIAIHKGQKYATVFINYETGQVFAVVKGKTQKAVESVFQMLVDRGLRDQIIAVACDMNAAYPTVIKKFLPKAEIVFDQFHDIQHLSAEDSANGSLGSGDAGTFAHAGFPRAP
jgi:transposase